MQFWLNFTFLQKHTFLTKLSTKKNPREKDEFN